MEITKITLQVLLYSYSKGDDPHREPYGTTSSPGLVAEEQRAQMQNRLGGSLGRRPAQDAAGGQSASGSASGQQGGTGFFLQRRLGLTTYAARWLFPAFHPTPADLPSQNLALSLSLTEAYTLALLRRNLSIHQCHY